MGGTTRWGVVALGLVWLLLPMQVRADDVMLVDGGRVRGTVIEESPTVGVRIKLLDGTIKVVPAAQVQSVRYDGEALTKSAPKEAPESSAPEEEDSPPRPPKRRRPAYVTSMDDAPQTTPEKAKAPEDEVRSARSMIVSGAVLTSFGFAGTIVGAVTMLLGTMDSSPGDRANYLMAGGIAVGIGTSIGVTGSVLLGVGLGKRRDLKREYASTVWVGASPVGATMTLIFE